MTTNVVHRTPLDVAGFKHSGLKRLPYSDGLFRLAEGSGTLESSVMEMQEPFDDLVASWNARIPEGAVLQMFVQVRSGAVWSRWFSLGQEEHAGFRSAGKQEDAAGFVDVDTLKLRSPAQAFRYRFLFIRARKPPELLLAAVAVSNDSAPARASVFRPGPWARELKIKPRSQMEEQERYRHNICSPTTLAMALDFAGVNRATARVADAARDLESGLYGVWPSNTALAARLGLQARVARLESLDDLQTEIAAGRPVAVSVTFGPGELGGSPIKKTAGHLFLVAGFTARGDVIVMDPAAPTRASVRRVYDREQFHKAWRVNKRGLAYLLSKPQRLSLVVGVPVTDLWEMRPGKRKFRLDDPDRLTQLLYGEKVVSLQAQGDWVRVNAVEQEDYLQGDRWQGYSGWVSAEMLIANPSPTGDAVVRTRQALVHVGSEIISLSVGTRLKSLPSGQAQTTHVLLLDGRVGSMPSDSLYTPASDPSGLRAQVVRTAELFLGTSYFWGGRSGVQPDLSVGVDCSGLTNLAHRIAGIDIPRDAHEQMLKSRRRSSSEIQPGDLAFLSESSRSQTISHVLLYTGGDGFIESRKSSGRTLRGSFSERFGKPLTEMKSGSQVTDQTYKTPRRRHIFFGSYLP